MNREDIRTRILDGLNDSPTSPRFWSLEEVNDLIDEAQEILSEEAGTIRRTALFSLKPGKQYYYTQGIARDIMVPYRLWMNNLTRRLTACSISDLDAQNQRWVDVSGTYPEFWFPISWNLFGVYPKMASGSESIVMDYIAWPRNLMDDRDETEFTGDDQDGLVLYGIYDGLMKRWAVDEAMVIFAKLVDSIVSASARGGIWRVDARAFQKSGNHFGR